MPSLLSVAPSLKGRGWPRYLRGLHLQLPEVPDAAHAAVHTETFPLPRASWWPCLPAMNAGPRATVMETSKGYSALIVSPSLRTCRTLLLAPQRSLQEGLMTPWVFTVAAGEGSGHFVVSRWPLTMQLSNHHRLSKAPGQPGMQRTDRAWGPTALPLLHWAVLGKSLHLSEVHLSSVWGGGCGWSDRGVRAVWVV